MKHSLARNAIAPRRGLALRFQLALIALGVLAAGISGYYVYAVSRTELVGSAEQQLLTATQVLGRRINLSVESAARNARLLGGHPATVAALTLRDQQSEHLMQQLFAQMLANYPEYFQLRLIGADEFGLERVRVDRDSGGSRIVTSDELQEKGHYQYVFNTLQQAPGSVYLSRVFINRETGIHAGEGKPVLLIATPVYGDSGKALGLIVINVDLNSLFALLAVDLPARYVLYLANRDGDYLIHPDRRKAFAFEEGREARVQREFPATSALVDASSTELVTLAQDRSQNDAAVAAFIRLQSLPQADDKSTFILGLAQPLSDVLQKSDDLGVRIMQIVLVFSILSVVVASLLSRAITRPLDQMMQAVRGFATDQRQQALPVQRHDEIGELARSFADMQRQINDQLQALHKSRRELDHLASHDVLTGLPNRRLLDERLEHALAKARRSAEHIALLYIDIDRFKEINDSYGHGVGDSVLAEAARRIQSVVREVDTVARLGGDEFIVLLDGNLNSNAISHIAQKILDALSPPIQCGDQVVHIGASIGISQSPQQGTSVKELTAAADHAMYLAKNSGRNQYRFATAPHASL